MRCGVPSSRSPNNRKHVHRCFGRYGHPNGAYCNANVSRSTDSWVLALWRAGMSNPRILLVSSDFPIASNNNTDRDQPEHLCDKVGPSQTDLHSPDNVGCDSFHCPLVGCCRRFSYVISVHKIWFSSRKSVLFCAASNSSTQLPVHHCLRYLLRCPPSHRDHNLLREDFGDSSPEQSRI